MKGKKNARGLSPLTYGKQGLPQGIHPAPAGAERSVTRGAEIKLGQVCDSKSCGDGKWTSRKEEMMPSPHPAGAAAVPSEEDTEISGIRISACVGIKYPFTEEGKHSCLSRACPKNKECKICCKDWSKE